jgi:hypothetical protein
MNWKHTIKVKHLFTDDYDDAVVKNSMGAIADELAKHPYMKEFDATLFRKLPDSNEFATTLEMANKLLNKLYDFADDNGIWID